MKKIKKFISILSLFSIVFGFFGYVPKSLANSSQINIPHKDYEHSFVVDKSEYISEIYKNDFGFTGISSRWPVDFIDSSVFLRSGKSSENMGSWSMVSDEDDKKDGALDFVYGDIFNSDKDIFFQYKVVFSQEYFNKEYKIKFGVFDTSSQVGGVVVSADNAGLGPKIISRSEWGANEGYMKWEPEYDEVKAFVIHHTAGEEGAKLENQASVVRNLYYGHAVSNGWGDIGYNYVIDVNGNIYEGRSGGGGVIGGHTLGYNSGTIGISLIGDYNIRNIETVQTEALVNLIAYKSFQYNIDPLGQVYLKNKTIRTVIGHKDLNSTQCPGNTIYERVSDISYKAKEVLANYPAKTFGAQLISYDNGVNVYGGDVNKIRVSLKNNGNTPWQSKGSSKLDIVKTNGELPTVLSDFGRAVEPGQIGNFVLDITPPFINKSLNQSFQAKIGGNNLNGGDFNINFNVITPEYKARITGKSPGLSLQSGKQGTLWVEVKNLGTKTWSSSDGIKLYTLNNYNSLFYTNGDWESQTSPGSLDNQNISPGSIGKITFLVTAPNSNSQYTEKFVIRSNNKNIEGGPNLNVEWSITVSGSNIQPISIDNNKDQVTYSKNIGDYDFSYISQSPHISLNPGETKSVWIEVKNTGKTDWYKSVLRLATLKDKESDFANGSWLSKNRIALNKEKVLVGETARFEFTITSPQNLGLNKEYFTLVADGVGWLKDIGIYWDFTVSPSVSSVNTPPNISSGDVYDFAYINQSSHLIMTTGETKQVWLEVKNTGNKAWKKGSSDPIRLATSNPRDRSSLFIPSNRVVMDRDTVNPGETVRFTFNITAPNNTGVYKEYFSLVREGISWFKDIGIYWQITVVANKDTDVTGSNSNTQLIGVPTGVQTVKVSSSGPFIIVNSSEVKLAEGGSGGVVIAFYKDGKHYFNFNGKTQEASGWVRIVPWAPQTILTIDSYTDRPAWNPSINDNKFKGAVEVRYSTKNKKLWIINDLNIEDYLQGVSEPLDSGNYEYIKAAVIAERSYIYYHLQRGGRWPDDFITLKNSRNGNGDDQIYQGYNYTLRANNVPRAVTDTRGEVVTYGGKPVLTPYYTQSDGRTRSISEVWGSKQSDYPWLVSVPDPWSAGKPLLGHGVGMSGSGARGMAADGKTYKEILRYFYTGTDIGKIETNRNVRVGIYYIEM
uniref:SpoIID/LytB domain-containing protein n=1 Tax=candidate division CPR3 bacterium TaxID=2268181 RepID=A0A7C4R4Z2_UNCC3